MALYEDDYVRVCADELIIKRYFFPLLRAKAVRTRDVRIVYFDEHRNAQAPLLRAWGKSTQRDVYWAFDISRCNTIGKTTKSNVIVDVEDGLCKGFTVENVHLFLDSLRCVAPISTIVVDHFDV